MFPGHQHRPKLIPRMAFHSAAFPTGWPTVARTGLPACWRLLPTPWRLLPILLPAPKRHCVHQGTITPATDGTINQRDRTMNKIQVLIGGIALVTAGAASAQSDWNLAQPGTSSWSSGNTTYHSNGATSQRSGNTTYHSNGSTSMQSGNMTFHSNGSTSMRSGNTTYHSNWSTSTRSGNMTFLSGGTTCMHSGSRTTC